MKKIPLLGGLAACFFAAFTARAADSYHLLKSLPVTTPGSWDYLAIDPGSHRLFVTHGTDVLVVDILKDEFVGTIIGGNGNHGVAFSPGKIFVSAGRANQANVVDPSSLKVVSTVNTGQNPDAILYEPVTREVYAFNGKDQTATVFAADTGAVVATITLPGKPEFAVSDPSAARIYDCIEDKSQVVEIDAKAHRVISAWSVAPGEGPTGLAFDESTHRLFVGTDDLLVILDSVTGRKVGTVAIGAGVDAVAFDPSTKLVFTSNGEDGTCSIIHEDDSDHFTLVQTLATAKTARTMQVDPTSHKIYLTAADFEPLAAGSPEHTRRKMIAGSMRILVFGPSP